MMIRYAHSKRDAIRRWTLVLFVLAQLVLAGNASAQFAGFELPAPEGYAWTRPAGVPLMILKPDEWSQHSTDMEKGAKMVFLVKGRNSTPDSRISTFTVFYVPNFSKRFGQAPSVQARRMLEHYAAGMEMVGEPTQSEPSSRLNSISVGAIDHQRNLKWFISVTSDDQKDGIFAYTFVAPSELWDTDWPTAKVILSNIAHVSFSGPVEQ